MHSVRTQIPPGHEPVPCKLSYKSEVVCETFFFFFFFFFFFLKITLRCKTEQHAGVLVCSLPNVIMFFPLAAVLYLSGKVL